MKKFLIGFFLVFFAAYSHSQTVSPFTAQIKTRNDFKRLSELVETYVAFKDMRFRTLNDKVILTDAEIRTLTFNRLTAWNAENGRKAEETLNAFANPGLGIRVLHQKGITGKGVVVAIIDQNLAGEHPEYAGKIKEYHDLGCDQSVDSGSMHGPAVTSLLVGNTTGTAPDSLVYYYAVPSWKADAKYYADALNMIIDCNKKLTEADKIRVVSVSAAPSGNGSPFKKNKKQWDEAMEKAANANILVLDCTETYGFINLGYYNPEDPENIELVKSGWPQDKSYAIPENEICAPSSYRTVAEEYVSKEYSYQYTGRGGLSWAIPYVAGVCALGWQVNPKITARQMKEILVKSAYVTKENARVINPAAVVTMAKNN